MRHILTNKLDRLALNTEAFLTAAMKMRISHLFPNHLEFLTKISLS